MAELPLKLNIVDRKVAAVPLDLKHPNLGGGTLIVRTSSLLDALHELFEFVWERAAPLRLASGDPVADRDLTMSRRVPHGTGRTSCRYLRPDCKT